MTHKSWIWSSVFQLIYYSGWKIVAYLPWFLYWHSVHIRSLYCPGSWLICFDEQLLTCSYVFILFLFHKLGETLWTTQIKLICFWFNLNWSHRNWLQEKVKHEVILVKQIITVFGDGYTFVCFPFSACWYCCSFCLTNYKADLFFLVFNLSAVHFSLPESRCDNRKRKVGS